ncbi:MAG: hypothetical protein LBC41_17340, partial [Clostridiales bacterium]|nr:hypothetical protein [Clostridiales bacterium]
SLAEYGEIHGKSGDTLRRMAENNMFKTAQKSTLSRNARRNALSLWCRSFPDAAAWIWGL